MQQKQGEKNKAIYGNAPNLKMAILAYTVSIFTSSKSKTGVSQGGSYAYTYFLLYVPANIDGFPEMWLWLRFGACFFSSKPDLNWALQKA